MNTSRNRPFRLAINGYGRIGRCFLRALYEKHLNQTLQVVAINEPADLATMAYLTRYDSTHGVFPGTVSHDTQHLFINDDAIVVSHGQNPNDVDWRALNLDLLVECSGQYSSREQLNGFIKAGSPRLLLSHPGNSADDVDATIVYGINQNLLNGTEKLVSCASCTTNASVPVLDLLNREFGLEHVFLTTLHSVMNDQPLIDGYHNSDLRRTRSAMQSIIPVDTGLARGVERLLPQLSNKVVAKAIRVPTLNVSAIDLMLQLQQPVKKQALNAALQNAAQNSNGLLAYSDQAHASIDFNHSPHSAIIDGSQTRVNGGNFVNLFIWFDNEWGFANRLIDLSRYWIQQIR